MILLDCDDVLAQTAKAVLDYINFTYGTSYTKEQIIDHTFENCGIGITKEQVARAFDAISNGPVDLLKPYPGAREFVQELWKLGPVACLTATASAAWTGRRALWLEEMVGIPAQKQIICGREHKKLFQGSIMIDDHWKNCDEFYHTQGRAFVLLDQPWNRDYDGRYGFRAHSYEDILSAVETYLK